MQFEAENTADGVDGTLEQVSSIIYSLFTNI